jgi:hypothetical protein
MCTTRRLLVFARGSWQGKRREEEGGRERKKERKREY